MQLNNVSKYYGHDDISKPVEVVKYKLPSFINKNVDVVKNILNSNNINYKIIGNGTKIIKQYPKTKRIITNKDYVFLITNDPHQKVPDVNGLSSREAKDLLSLLGVKVNLDGVGYVTGQSVAPGVEITKGMEITLSLNPKFSE